MSAKKPIKTPDLKRSTKKTTKSPSRKTPVPQNAPSSEKSSKIEEPKKSSTSLASSRQIKSVDKQTDKSGKETDKSEQEETSKRQKKQIKKMHKLKRVKKSEKLSDPVAERERQRIEKQELNAMQQKWMAKKEAQFNKKIEELIKNNNELKSFEDILTKENEIVKNDQSYKELELEKLTHFWAITRGQLEEKAHHVVELETSMQRQKAAHIEQVSLLHKRISMLQLETRLEQIVSTQTDPFGEDTDCTGYASVSVQTESDFSRQKINEILRQHDDELGDFIAEIENSKLQAQGDYKFAVVQMEQGLREEHDEEVRAIKEEKDRQLEEMVRIHSEQLHQIEGDKMRLKAELNEEITNYKVQLQQYVHTLDQKEAECNDLLDRLQSSEKQYDDLSLKYRSLNTLYERNRISGEALKRDIKIKDDLRNRLQKVEDINEILLGEYQKLEHERNMFSEQISYLLKTGLGSDRNEVPQSISVQNKAYEIGEQLDEIRRKYGGLK